jgi:hypothetical protein
MGWENRRNRKYYYRSRWVGGRVVKEYVRGGDEIKAAEADAKRAAALRSLRQKLAALEAAIAPLHEFADMVTEAAMIVAGYHRHDRGPWRKRRVST